MAAPHAVGVAALLMQSRPDLNPDEVESRLKLSGAWVRDDLHDASSITHRWTQRVDARVALLVDDGADFDGDGCPNGKEFQIAASSQGSGGLRNPLNEWDYFNPTGDGMNRVDDILAVVNQYFDDVGTPGYNPGTDRTPLGPNDWNLGPPNGIQRVDDILAAVKHYFHDCS